MKNLAAATFVEYFAEMGLLMAGVLTTKQLSPVNLLQQQPFKIGNGVNHSIQSQLSPNAQAIPLEFLQSDRSAQTDLSIPPRKKENLLHKFRRNKHSLDYSRLVQSKKYASSLNKDHTKKENLLHKFRRKNPFLDYSSLVQSDKYAQSLGKDCAKPLGESEKFNSKSLPNLKFGSSGIAVRALQRLLVSNGYPIGVDGDFGPLTETAVMAFQNQQNLRVDGIVGQRTWHTLSFIAINMETFLRKSS
ncbi:peptidoglycan-binding domain-containing protein [Nostoc sp. FACHB-888]|uniref:peptidoglycan-binding domain-containing protein n=1 Tax=Nostoc sp. FACHB-888 TaxID=2692842 RepID=UPI001F558973|nr:peptidoglycan-binding domain-containing protein [Nostoc sp. FACHB-888]